MKKTGWILILLLSTIHFGFAQAPTEIVKGKVAEINEEGEKKPLIGVNIFWEGTTNGTSSDANGKFEIEVVNNSHALVFSYIGYENETIHARHGDSLEVIMKNNVELEEVSIVKRQKTTNISLLGSIKVETIGEEELCKAACCNLSESFETNPSIDVSFTDAVTGARQIQMLGLSGPNVQLSQENMPGIRGLSSIYGLTFIPGTWIESIQLNKGTGTVVNGYESIAGQINLELRKPETADRMYLNLFANNENRLEANLNLAHRVKNSNWSTALLLHAKENSKKFDHNEDGFLDMPTGNTLTALNRWNYAGDNGMIFQFGIKGTTTQSQGGEMDFSESDAFTNNSWGMKMDIKRLEAWAKLGYVFKDKPWKSIGSQYAASTHKQESYFGLNDYDAKQQSLYANFIYQSIIGNTNHQFKTGISFQYDKYDEDLNELNFDRKESVPGTFFEYSFIPNDAFSLVAGIRADHHSLFGWFTTPRLHVRYAPLEKSAFRFSVGRGQRTANIISENSGILASSRELIILGNREDKPYGFNPEVAWNFGVNFTQKFMLDYREGSFSIDYYRTDFDQQIVMDLDQSPQLAVFYELNGKSYSNSFQAQLDYEVIKRLDARLAYRWFDVKTTYDGNLLEKPLVGRHRAFMNMAYETRNYWKFDYTINWKGKKRIPDTSSNPLEYQMENYSPDFVLMNAQVTKVWNERFEVYLGMENIANYKQANPIIASDDPFGPYFDSSLVWGPIFGRKSYVGIRFKIK